MHWSKDGGGDIVHHLQESLSASPLTVHLVHLIVPFLPQMHLPSSPPTPPTSACSRRDKLVKHMSVFGCAPAAPNHCQSLSPSLPPSSPATAPATASWPTPPSLPPLKLEGEAAGYLPVLVQQGQQQQQHQQQQLQPTAFSFLPASPRAQVAASGIALQRQHVAEPCSSMVALHPQGAHTAEPQQLPAAGRQQLPPPPGPAQSSGAGPQQPMSDPGLDVEDMFPELMEALRQQGT